MFKFKKKVATIEHLDDGRIELRRDAVSYRLTPDQLFEAARSYLSGRDVVRSNNITDLHDYLVDEIGVRSYKLTIEWRESGDNGIDDYPYDLSVDIVAWTENGMIEQNLGDTDWIGISLIDVINGVDLTGKRKKRNSENRTGN